MQTRRRRLTFHDRVWSHVDKRGPEACWPWTGSTSHGYGLTSVTINGRTHVFGAHRAVYELTHGRIPDRSHVCHRCDNPVCCNPAHLFLGTAKDNVQDCVQKGRRSKHRTPYNAGDSNSHAKLTERQAKAILRLVERGSEQTEIAKTMGLDKGTIWRLVHGHTWKHLPRPTQSTQKTPHSCSRF